MLIMSFVASVFYFAIPKTYNISLFPVRESSTIRMRRTVPSEGEEHSKREHHGSQWRRTALFPVKENSTVPSEGEQHCSQWSRTARFPVKNNSTVSSNWEQYSKVNSTVSFEGEQHSKGEQHT